MQYDITLGKISRIAQMGGRGGRGNSGNSQKKTLMGYNDGEKEKQTSQ